LICVHVLRVNSFEGFSARDLEMQVYRENGE